jgi:hypothetical protein
MIPTPEPSPTALERFTTALASQQPPDRHRARKLIAEATPTLHQHVTRRVAMATILELFNREYGLKMTLANFRRLYREEAAKLGLQIDAKLQRKERV